MLPADHEASQGSVQTIGVADIPGGGQFHLLRHGNDFSIQFDDDELMGSRVRVSEQALGRLACERLTDRHAQVLIGGLGMGFTLGAALSVLGPSAHVTVAELVPQVVAWAKGSLSHIFAGSLADQRLSIEIADVHDVIARAPGRFDAILLDVDNGPDGLVQLANERLYCNWGLRSSYAALRPGGTLAVWSAYPDHAFVDRLEGAGFAVEEVIVPTDAYEEAVQHIIWLATKP